MAGKAPVFASNRLAFAMDGISKNTLVDLVIDLVRRELTDAASDEQIAEFLQDGWLRVAENFRGGKHVSLTGRLATWDRHKADHEERQREQLRLSYRAKGS